MEPLAARDTPWARTTALVVGGSTVGLALHDGGYFGGATAVVCALVLALLALRLLVARSPLRGASRAGVVAAAALLGLCTWTALSAGWSDAPGRSLLELDRTLLYAATFVLVLGLRDGSRSARLLLRATSVAFALVVALALASRLTPDLLDVAAAQQDVRLSWPLGYWNALGLAAAVCLLAGLALASDDRERAVVRTLAGTLVPLGSVALYLTLSRGAIVAAAAAVLVLLAVRRGPALIALLATGVPAALAVFSASRADVLTSPALASEAGVMEGHRLAAVLALAVGAAALAQLPAILVAERVHAPRWWTRPVRRAVWGTGFAVAAVVALALGAAGATARLWDDVTASGFSPGVADQRDRLANTDTNGRIDQWRVGWDAFRAEPLTGTGAGTYELTWERDRPFDLTARDAHSLYVETASELGLPGLALLLVALGIPLVAIAARLRRRPVDPVWQAALALAVLWLVHAGVDWDWELPAVSLWAVALLGAACARGGWALVLPLWARLLAVAGLVGVLLAVPARVGASQQDLTRALAAFRDGDCRATVDRALAASGHAGGRAEPFELLAYCDVRLGSGALAVEAAAAGVRRDPGNWELRYAQALVTGATGGDPRPALRAAIARNPRQPQPRAVLEAVDGAPRSAWRSISRRAPLPLSG